MLVKSHKASLALIDELINGFLRNSFSNHQRFKALFESAGDLLRTSVFQDFFYNVQLQVLVFFEFPFPPPTFSCIRIFLSLGGSVYAIRADIPLKLADEIRMIPMEHPANFSKALFCTEMKLQFFPFIQG